MPPSGIGDPTAVGGASDINPLPSISDFTEDERLLARFVVGAIHSGGKMLEGRLFECLLSRLLEATSHHEECGLGTCGYATMTTCHDERG